jgi:hypothetical protein
MGIGMAARTVKPEQPWVDVETGSKRSQHFATKPYAKDQKVDNEGSVGGELNLRVLSTSPRQDYHHPTKQEERDNTKGKKVGGIDEKSNGGKEVHRIRKRRRP